MNLMNATNTNRGAEMKTTHRSNSVKTLQAVAEVLLSRGFAVSSIVIPENEWVGGVPYFHTIATNRDILEARRAV